MGLGRSGEAPPRPLRRRAWCDSYYVFGGLAASPNKEILTRCSGAQTQFTLRARRAETVRHGANSEVRGHQGHAGTHVESHCVDI